MRYVMTNIYNSFYIYNIYTGQSMSRTHSRVVMPQFPELSSLPAPVFSSLCASSGPLVNFFRSCFAIKLPAARSCEGVRPYLNSIQLQVELVYSGCLTQILDIYICLRSRPVDPDVVRPFVRSHVENSD